MQLSSYLMISEAAPSPVAPALAPVPVTSPATSPATYSAVGCFEDADVDVNNTDSVEGRIMGSQMTASEMSADVGGIFLPRGGVSDFCGFPDPVLLGGTLRPEPISRGWISLVVGYPGLAGIQYRFVSFRRCGGLLAISDRFCGGGSAW